MNTNKTLGSNKQHSDRECLYKTIVTVTGKEPVFRNGFCLFNCKYPGIINVRIFTEKQHNHDGTGLSQVVLNVIHNLVYRLQVYVQTTYLSQQSSIIRYTAFTGP